MDIFTCSVSKHCSRLGRRHNSDFVSLDSRVADPDPNRIRLQSGQWIRIRIQEGKMTHKSRKNKKNSFFEVLDVLF
jgi:hypothetical protein